MARVAADDAGPSAFEVKLSISTGSHSPVGDSQTVKVNAGSTVRMVFMNGAYVLRDVHGRDAERLQKDFDLYLVRPGRDDIVLNPSREIADYGVMKNEPMDQLQFRHKTLPIPLIINLSEGDDRKIEVNSGFPLMDTIPTICDMFGIKEHAELSLARLAVDSDSENTMQYEWLALTSSLNGQGVNDGDTLLLRKKFFILNDDVHEAMKENEELKELIYQQVRVQYLTSSYVGNFHNDDTSCAMVSSLLHHIEQGSESISDDQATSNVMPCDRQKDSSFFAQIVTTYYREHIGNLKTSEAKDMLLKLVTETENILINYYPVKISEESEEHIVAIDRDCVSLCRIDAGRLKTVENKTWRIRDLRDTDISSQKEDILKVNILGFWQPFFTKYREPLANYLMEASKLMKKKIDRARLSQRITSPEVFKRNSQLVQENHHNVSPSREPLAPETKKIEEQSVDKESFEWPVGERAAVGESVVVETTQELKSEDISAALDDISSNSPSGSAADLTVYDPSSTEIEFHVPETNPPLNTPREDVKKDLSRITVHIPDFLELDYRQILDDYKLFHIVVMKQDVRPVLLHTGKPISEVVHGICGTFSISNPSDYYLWIPTGIQSIIEKYGGKPKIRVGKFRKRQSSSLGDFAPRMDSAKSLKDQYDFTIKPYLLHLRKYQAEEEVDAPDESTLDCGEEWPDCEHPDIARYRKFYQSWTGMVQGAYPVDKKVAIRLAAMLTQVYYGDRERARVWPPPDYEPKSFLPEKFRSSFGVAADIEKKHKELTGTTTHECINDIVEGCQKLITHQGVFFDVSVPVKSDIMAVIPWNKMEQRWFGINQHGIFSVNKESGKILFTHRFSDIYKWSSTENSFKLNFKEWAEDFHAYTYQTKEILNTLELFIQMTVKGRINQAPSRPHSISSMPGTQTPPRRSTSSPMTPIKSPLDDAADPPKRGSTSTPTSYDL